MHVEGLYCEDLGWLWYCFAFVSNHLAALLLCEINQLYLVRMCWLDYDFIDRAALIDVAGPATSKGVVFFVTRVMGHCAHFEIVSVGVGKIYRKVHIMLFVRCKLLVVLWNISWSQCN